MRRTRRNAVRVPVLWKTSRLVAPGREGRLSFGGDRKAGGPLVPGRRRLGGGWLPGRPAGRGRRRARSRGRPSAVLPSGRAPAPAPPPAAVESPRLRSEGICEWRLRL